MVKSFIQNKLHILIIFVTSVLLSSCVAILTISLNELNADYYSKRTIYFNLINNSDTIATFVYPHCYRRDWQEHQMYLGDNEKDIDICGIDYNDTTMINYARSSAYGIEWVSFLPKYNEKRCLSFYYTIEEMTPYDTMRIFVYEDKYCCVDTIEYGFRVPFKLDEYLVRYDISTDDAYGLMNGNGEIEICYPPDEG